MSFWGGGWPVGTDVPAFGQRLFMPLRIRDIRLSRPA